MWRHMPSVYCRSPPLPSPKSKSTQRPGPSRRSKSTSNDPPVKWTSVMCAVTSQEARSFGELWMMAVFMSNGTNLNENTDEKPLETPLLGSVACTRQKYVPFAVTLTVVGIVTEVCPDPCATVAV